MAAYLGRFTPADTGWGILAYPDDPEQPEMPKAQANSPWWTPDGRTLTFLRLGHDADVALGGLLAAIQVTQQTRPLPRSTSPY